MKRINLIITYLIVMFFLLVACDQQRNIDLQNETTQERGDCAYLMPMRYYVYSSLELENKCTKLSELTSIPIEYGSYITAEEWESSNYTAKILFSSDGVKLEQAELVLNHFIDKKYQSVQMHYIPFNENTIYKDVGHIDMILQRTNDDGSTTNVFEYTMYYVIKDDEVYITRDSRDIVEYISKECLLYHRDVDESHWKEIWIDQDVKEIYFADLYQGKYTVDLKVEKYIYERTEDGIYIVEDNEGSHVYTLKELDGDIISDGENLYKHNLVNGVK